jgi:hypothetical protein
VTLTSLLTTQKTFPRFALHISNYYPRWGTTNEVSQSPTTFSNILKLFHLGGFSQEVVNAVTQLALSDRDQEVQLEALNAVSYLTHKTEPLPLIRNFPGTINEVSIQRGIEIRNFEAGIVDPNWRVRRAWIKFAGNQITDGKPTHFVLLDQACI